MTTRRNVLEDLVGQARIGAEDVLRLRAAVFSDMTVSPEEAELLFEINDRAASTAPEWRAFFLEAMTDYVVRQQDPPGYVDAAKADWLAGRIAQDGRLKSRTELELLIRVLEQATDAPPSLSRVALDQIAAFALHPERRGGDGPTLTSEEVQQIRRVLYAFAGDGGGAAVGRAEADILFALNDAARGRPNAPAWRELFVHAIGAALLAAAGYRAPDRTEAKRRQAWLEAPSAGVGSFLGRMAETLARDPLAGFRRQPDLWEERNARRDAAEAEAARLDEEEVAWLAARIGRDGVLDDNEVALIRFVQQEAGGVHPSLQPLVEAAERLYGRGSASAYRSAAGA